MSSTDDMNVAIRADRTNLDLTRAVMEKIKNIEAGPEIVAEIKRDFEMSDHDAILAFDRVQGGIIWALTARLDNCPDRGKNPLAYHAFHEAWQTLPARADTRRQIFGWSMAGMVSICARTP